MKIDLFKLKIIAFISLTFFTFSISGLVSNPVLQFLFLLIGYIGLPLFAFIISEGYSKTRNINKYLLRVLAISVLTALPHRYVCISMDNAFHPQLLYSSALTGFFCLISIVIYDKIRNKTCKIICIIFTVSVSFFVGLELAPHALIIMYIIHICRDKKFIELSYYITSYCVVIAIVSLFMLNHADESLKGELMRNIAIIGSAAALPLIKKYDGTKGPSIKFLSYFYYLIIMLIIIAIKML